MDEFWYNLLGRDYPIGKLPVYTLRPVSFKLLKFGAKEAATVIWSHFTAKKNIRHLLSSSSDSFTEMLHNTCYCF